jgi:hypothetical protein
VIAVNARKKGGNKISPPPLFPRTTISTARNPGMGSFAKPRVNAIQTLSDPERAALKKLDEFIDAMNLVVEGNAAANDPMLMDDVTRSISRLGRSVLVAAASRMMNLRLDPIPEPTPIDFRADVDIAVPQTRQ